MKHGKRPTREQKKQIHRLDLNWADWLVVKDTPAQMVLQHRESGSIKTIHKGAGA